MATKKTTATKKLSTAKKAAPRAPRAPRAARASGGAVGSGVDVIARDAIAKHLAEICADGFFQPLGNNLPFMKVGVDGISATGKTHALAELAIGLHRRIKSTKPVAIVDTESAARFLVPMFEAAGVPVVVRPTTTLVEWREAVQRAEAGAADIVITDSLTHLWEDTVSAFCEARGIEGLEGPAAWVAVKEVWHREWAAPFRDARVHLLFAARAGDAYVDVVDNNGKRESIKAGTKVRGENEIAFEPSLHLSLRIDEQLGRVAIVEKDRTRITQGAVVALPLGGIYAAFADVVDATLAGAVEPIATEQRSSGSLFGNVTNRGRIKGLVGDVKGLLDMHWPAQGKTRQTRANAIQQAFGHCSWPRIERSDEVTLQAGLQRLHAVVAAGGPTVIAQTAAVAAPDGVVATIRAGLSQDPGDPIHRSRLLAHARELADTLTGAHQATALGVIANARRRFELADVDQREPDDLIC